MTSLFLLWNTKADISKNDGSQTILVTADFHCMNKEKKYLMDNFLFHRIFMGFVI